MGAIASQPHRPAETTASAHVENDIGMEVLRLAVLDVGTEMPFLDGGIGCAENRALEVVSIPYSGRLSGLVN